MADNMGKLATMKFFNSVIAIVLVFSLTACTGQTKPVTDDADLQRIIKNYPELADKEVEKAAVTRIVDGDTVELDNGAKVRLIGVNTPEVHGKVQPYGKEASAYTKRELLGKNVLMFRDVSDTDKYGRLLRYVFIAGEEEMYNELLVQEGYAQVMTISPNVAYAELFVQKQREARERNKGLWGDSFPAEQGQGAPSEAPSDAPSEAPSDAPSVPSCPNPIKGNINSKGDKIYHVPGGSAYKRTIPEQWFCSEQEAQEAGFRKAMN